MFCGQSGHVTRDCPHSSSHAAKARVANAASPATPEDSLESKN
jgi:hypothetical protein